MSNGKVVPEHDIFAKMQDSNEKFSIVIDNGSPSKKMHTKDEDNYVDVWEEETEHVSTDRELLLETESPSCFPVYLKSIILALVFGVIFAIPAIVILGSLQASGWLSFNTQGNPTRIAYLCSILAACSWASGCIIIAMISFVFASCGYLSYFAGRPLFNGKAKDFLAIIARSRTGIGIIAGTTIALDSTKPHMAAIPGVNQVYSSLVVFGIMLIIKALAMSRIESQYFAKNLGLRMTGNKRVLKILAKLWGHFLPEFEVSSKHQGPNRHNSFHISKDQAQHLGNTLYKAIGSTVQEDVILPEHFIPVLEISEASFFVEYIDFDRNGSLTQDDFEEGINFIYEEHKRLHHCYTDSDKMIVTLDNLGTFFCVALNVLMAIGMIGLTMTNQFLLQVNFAVVINFFFKDVFTRAFQCLIFVFSQHAYDVGDTVFVHRHIYHVKTIGLWETTMVDNENQVTYFRNLELANRRIANFSRSPPQAVELTLAIHSSTTRDQLAKIDQKINDFIKANPRDYTIDDCYVKNIAIINSEAFTFQLQYTQRSSFTVLKIRAARHRKFMEKLQIILNETGTQNAPYSLDLPRVSVTSH